MFLYSCNHAPYPTTIRNLIDENEKWQEYVKNQQLNILPNQNGVFCDVGKLRVDVDILEEYKDILMDLVQIFSPRNLIRHNIA